MTSKKAISKSAFAGLFTFLCIAAVVSVLVATASAVASCGAIPVSPPGTGTLVTQAQEAPVSRQDAASQDAASIPDDAAPEDADVTSEPGDDGGDGPSGKEPDLDSGTPVPEISTPPGPGARIGSAWHPDPDGDGIEGELDECDHHYNPGGKLCDLRSPTEGGPVVDLHAEHVTPYGAWMSFSSPHTTQYGWDALVLVSDSKTKLASQDGIESLALKSGVTKIKVRAPLGRKVPMPVILHDLDPEKTYYATVRRSSYQGISTKAGNVLSFTTHPEPPLVPPTRRPRAILTPEMMTAAGKGYPRLKGIGAAAVSASNKPNQYNHAYCIPASILAITTGEVRYRGAANRLLSSIRDRWSGSALNAGNDFRRANALLSTCTDLMWPLLSRADREKNVRTFLGVSEKHLYVDTRYVDSDEVISRTRTAIIDGIVACNSPDIDPSLSVRGCKLLDWGKRMMYGVALVKARRDVGPWAQSGGHLPDGSFYHQGSSTYWLQMLIAARNAGGKVDQYASWVRGNLRAVNIHGMTPRGKGYYSHGDVEAYSDSEEPGSLTVHRRHGEGAALRMAFLASAGDSHGAALAAGAEKRYAALDNDRARAYRWPLMAYGPPASGDGDEPTVFYDSGIGLFYDRTSWGPDASALIFHAGWNGIDHSHSDNGHFQFYRRGHWLTHESLAYDGPGATSGGHSVVQLRVDGGKRGERTDQYNRSTVPGSRILRASSSASHSYVSSDITAAYQSHRYRSYRYPLVRRDVFWIKPAREGSGESVVVMDEIHAGDAGEGGGPSWHLQIPVAPQVTGRTATAVIGSGPDASLLAVTSVLPRSVKMESRAPDGKPSKYPGEVYTHRVVVDSVGKERIVKMVTVLYATDVGGELPVITAVESEGTVGVSIGGDVVLFGEGDRSIVVPGAKRLWWTGLDPGRGYSVAISGESVTLSAGGIPASSAGIISI